jgi:N6-adenosine-specific RNA methylase IME4
MKHQVIVADPPWGFNDGLKKMKRRVKRSAEAHYPTMTASEVAAMPVDRLIDPEGCLLALWVPGSMLQAGLDVMQAWGFRQKQLFVWIKLKKGHREEPDVNKSTRVGMGRLFRQSHEVALIGTAGKSVYPRLKDKGQRSVAFDLNLGHSCKPATLQRRLERMFPDTNRIELFARRSLDGWTCLGNAIDGKDITTAILERSAL